MRVNWILEHFAVENYREELMQAINAYEDNYLELKPFEYFQKDITEHLSPDNPTIALCTIQLAREIKNKVSYRSYFPGVIYGEKEFQVNNYYKDYYDFVINKNYVCMPFWMLQKQKQFLFDMLGNNGCLFIRPNSGGKSFTGFVAEYDRFDRDLEQAFLVGENLNELVCIAEPQNIETEWRMVIIEKKVVTGSQYKFGGEKELSDVVPIDVWRFAQRVVDAIDNPPQACYTMDIGRTTNGLGIVELNSMSCSGLYKCNITAIVHSLREFVIKDFCTNVEVEYE